MVDIARLGFSADTSDLDQATVKLNRLVPAARSAEKATDGFNKAAAGVTRGTSGAAAGITSFSTAVNRAATGSDMLSKSAMMSSTAMGTVSGAAATAATSIQRLNVVSQQFGPPTALWKAYQAELARIPATAGAAQSSLARLGRAANDNINQMQATPGNIAAQFQDIGVTAAGGMQPYLIALQQGTQLSAAMQGGLGNLLAGFAQLLSPISLLTIALVGLLAVWIQSVDWYNAAASALYLLADAMQVVAPYAVALGGILLVAFAPQIIAWIAATTVAIGTGLVTAISTATMAMVSFALVNPFAAIVLAIGLVVVAMYALNDVFGGVFTSILTTVKNTANFIIGGFVGAFNTIKRTWSMLPAAIGDAVAMTVNMVNGAIDRMINASIRALNGLLAGLPDWMKIGDGRIDFVASSGKMNVTGAAAAVGGVAADEIGRAQGRDWVGGFADAVSSYAGKGADWLRNLAGGMVPAVDPKKAGGGAAGGTSAAAQGQSEAEKQAAAFEKMRLASEGYTRAKAAEAAAVGLGAREAAMLKHETDLINQAIQQGIPLTDARTQSIREWSKAMTDADMALANAQGWEKLSQQMQDIDRDLMDQRAEMGLTEEQTARYKWEVVWLRDAMEGLVEPTMAQIEALRLFAQGAADSEIQLQRTRGEIDRARDSMNFMRDGVKGFVSDLRGGLEQGKSFFSAFADSVLNALNKVIDKLLEVAMNAAFDGGSSGGIGGLLKGIGAAIGGSFGAGSFESANLAASSGAATFKFAKGGVVNKRTMFDYAGGRGMMGEAGKEAIMPLQRGPDGALGVAVNGGSGGRGTFAPQVNVNNTYVLDGAVSSAEVQASIRQSAAQTADDVRRSIPQVLSEYQRDGAIV